jgi:hypothetical protein
LLLANIYDIYDAGGHLVPSEEAEQHPRHAHLFFHLFFLTRIHTLWCRWAPRT